MSEINQGSILLRNLKKSAGLLDALSLPIGNPEIARLRPVATEPQLINSQDVHLLTEWRNRFSNAFLTEFAATVPQTTHWLIHQIGLSEHRILFMVDNLSGIPFGSMGLVIHWDTLYGEGDAILRGGDAPKGAMTQALRTLLSWAKEIFGLKELGIRVRSDNSALEFYRKMNFQETKRVPLRKIESPGKVSLVEDASLPADSLSVIYMRFN